MIHSALFHGEALTVLRHFQSDSVDALVSDPPAGIGFMGKDWDSDKGGRDAWVAWMTEVMTEVHRVLKPGAHGLVWALPRTSHWTATALENAGFEVRDVVNHIFGTGFPKSLNIGKAIDKAAGANRTVIGSRIKNTATHYYESGAKQGSANYGVRQGDAKVVYENINLPITAPATPEAKQWDGWGTALKPAHEHWILIRKPLGEKTVAANVLKHGTGGINIDGCRIGISGATKRSHQAEYGEGGWRTGHEIVTLAGLGRFPANLILSEEAAADLDQHSGVSPAKPAREGKRGGRGFGQFDHEKSAAANGIWPADVGGGASRFFYVAKASKSDKGADNKHPTVKSTALMEYLIKLVTPPGGIVLDLFMGSGSTAVAANRTGFNFIGIEMCEEYFETAAKRCGSACSELSGVKK